MAQSATIANLKYIIIVIYATSKRWRGRIRLKSTIIIIIAIYCGGLMNANLERHSGVDIIHRCFHAEGSFSVLMQRLLLGVLASKAAGRVTDIASSAQVIAD